MLKGVVERNVAKHNSFVTELGEAVHGPAGGLGIAEQRDAELRIGLGVTRTNCQTLETEFRGMQQVLGQHHHAFQKTNAMMAPIQAYFDTQKAEMQDSIGKIPDAGMIFESGVDAIQANAHMLEVTTIPAILDRARGFMFPDFLKMKDQVTKEFKGIKDDMVNNIPTAMDAHTNELPNNKLGSSVTPNGLVGAFEARMMAASTAAAGAVVESGLRSQRHSSTSVHGSKHQVPLHHNAHRSGPLECHLACGVSQPTRLQMFRSVTQYMQDLAEDLGGLVGDLEGSPEVLEPLPRAAKIRTAWMPRSPRTVAERWECRCDGIPGFPTRQLPKS